MEKPSRSSIQPLTMSSKGLANLLVTDPETNTDIEFNKLWKEATEDYVLLHFFRRFGWSICKYLANDLSKFVNEINSNDSSKGKIKLIGIGIEMQDYKEFVEGKYFDGKIYINNGKTLYKSLNFKKSSICSCFGLSCKLFKIADKAKKLQMKNNLSGDLSQFGGEVILTNKGEIILVKQQKDPTDLIAKEEIELAIESHQKQN